MKEKIKQELIPWLYILGACVLFSLLMQLLINYPFFKFLMALIGMIYCLFLPGYLIVRFFLDKRLDFWEKLAVSFGISVLVQLLAIIFITKALNIIPFSALPNFFVLLAVMIITIVTKRYQKPIVSFFIRFKFLKSKPKKVPKKKSKRK